MNSITWFFKSRILFFVAFISFAFSTYKAQAQVITTLPLANVNLCACSQVIVSYSATGAYAAGNVFTVQLSDGVGNFVAATNIGTLA
ncbi:MAG: hypothetical protein IT257_10150, partial [Chitinophagaceae bacterium]|nr:hypothetical protein [Chitinophagaceae bacterium]